MFKYGKTAQTAISALSRLAELYGDDKAASSPQIAKNRGISKPLVAKLLTTLSQAGIVTGAPGPGGGYKLAKPPAEIRLMDVVQIFEKAGDQIICPFGPNWCGNNDPCPLHDELTNLDSCLRNFLETNTLQLFVNYTNTPK